MGMGIKENEITVAKIIANDSKGVRPLAIKVMDFNVRGLTSNEAEVSLEQLKKKGVINKWNHCWGFFIKSKGKKYLLFERTADEPLYADAGDRTEFEVYQIDFNQTALTKYLESGRHLTTPVARLIERRGEDFHYKNEPLHFVDKTSIHYKLFSILYGDNGEEKAFPYNRIDEELIRLGEKKIENHKKILRRIQNAVNNGLHHRVDERLKQFVKIVPRFGVEFKNPAR